MRLHRLGIDCNIDSKSNRTQSVFFCNFLTPFYTFFYSFEEFSFSPYEIQIARNGWKILHAYSIIIVTA